MAQEKTFRRPRRRTSGLWTSIGVILLLSQPEQSAAKPRIIDGVSTDIQEFPFYVLVSQKYYSLNNVPVHCGGAMVHPMFAISAFHCFKDAKSPEKVFVVNFFITDRCKPPPYKPLKINWVHKLPDSQLGPIVRNDIVVVELKQPFILTSFAKLPTKPPIESQMGTVLGFGLTKILGKGDTKDLPCRLQKINEFILPLERCDFSADRIIGAFCAYNPLRNFATACRGDSGGPWLSRETNGGYTLVGVSSFGDSLCNQEKFHDSFTNVYYYVQWITDVIKARSVPQYPGQYQGPNQVQYPVQYPPQNPVQYPPQNPVQYPMQSPIQFPPQNPVRYPAQYPDLFVQQDPGLYPMQYPVQYPMSYSYQNQVQTAIQPQPSLNPEQQRLFSNRGVSRRVNFLPQYFNFK